MDIDSDLIESLRPNFSERDLEDLKSYHEFNQKYHDDLNKDMEPELMEHKVFGPILKMQTDEQRQKRNEYSAKLLGDAIASNQWDAYTADLITQGITYAQMGLTYQLWYEVVVMVKEYIQPYVLCEFADDSKGAFSVFNGLGKLVDYAMRVIAESFFNEKNKTIITQQKKQEQLIEELEKVNKELQNTFEELETSHEELEEQYQQLEEFQSELTESEERFRALFDNTSDFIIMVNKEGVIQYINRASADRKRSEIVGTSLYDGQSKENKAMLKKVVKSVFDLKKNVLYEITVDGDNSNVIYSCSACPMFANNLVYGAVIIARDVTLRKRQEKKILELNATLEKKVEKRTANLAAEIEERKKAEQKINELNEELEVQLENLKATNNELESFSYTVSHDLRAPLRSIDGFAKILNKRLAGKLDKDEVRYLTIISESVEKMGELIDDLLSFSRMGRLKTNTSSFDMKLLIDEIFKELVLAESERQVDMKIGDLPLASADREMMKHVISNLLGNAIKFSGVKEKTLIEISGYVDNGYCIYTIKDNGVGFEKEYANKLFNIFQRLHSDDEFEGTGVGLAIVQRIIHKHEGKVWADSELGKSATFSFSLPTK